MGQSFDACIVFGVAFPEDYLYDNEEKLLENTEFEYPLEALEKVVDDLARGTNLELKTVGYWDGEDTTRTILAYAEPQIETGYGEGDYYTVGFDPKRLDVGVPTAHPEAMRIAEKLGLDWSTAGWLLCWSVS